jgi:hypothetical protein
MSPAAIGFASADIGRQSALADVIDCLVGGAGMCLVLDRICALM